MIFAEHSQPVLVGWVCPAAVPASRDARQGVIERVKREGDGGLEIPYAAASLGKPAQLCQPASASRATASARACRGHQQRAPRLRRFVGTGLASYQVTGFVDSEHSPHPGPFRELS